MDENRSKFSERFFMWIGKKIFDSLPNDSSLKFRKGEEEANDSVFSFKISYEGVELGHQHFRITAP